MYNVASVNLSLGFNDNNLTSKTWFLVTNLLLWKAMAYLSARHQEMIWILCFSGIVPQLRTQMFFCWIDDHLRYGKVARAQYYRHRPYFLLQPAKKTHPNVFAPGTMIYSSVHAFDLDNDDYNETYAPNSYDWCRGQAWRHLKLLVSQLWLSRQH